MLSISFKTYFPFPKLIFPFQSAQYFFLTKERRKSDVLSKKEEVYQGSMGT